MQNLSKKICIVKVKRLQNLIAICIGFNNSFFFKISTFYCNRLTFIRSTFLKLFSWTLLVASSSRNFELRPSPRDPIQIALHVVHILRWKTSSNHRMWGLGCRVDFFRTVSAANFCSLTQKWITQYCSVARLMFVKQCVNIYCRINTENTSVVWMSDDCCHAYHNIPTSFNISLDPAIHRDNTCTLNSKHTCSL